MLTNQEQVEEMIRLATKYHNGQTDAGGLPYILHPLYVSFLLKTTDLELICIAIGHDLLSNTILTIDKLETLGFSDRVVDGIISLTQQDAETLDQYKQRLILNRDVIAVKMAELFHDTRWNRTDDAKVNEMNQFYTFLQNIIGPAKKLSNI